MTNIPLGFADFRIYNHNGDVFCDMWPALGTQMTLPLRGAVSGKRVVRNTDEQLVLAKGLLRYAFQFSRRQAGPDALKYSVSILGVVSIGTHWGDISSEGKQALRASFGGPLETPRQPSGC